MSKVIVISLAFAPARIIIECMKQVYKTIGITDFEHYVLHQHYPIDQQRNDQILRTVFESYKCVQFDLGSNIGLSAGYNYLIQQAKITEDGIVIGIDLDTYPETKGWGEALVKVTQADKSLGWVSIMNPHAKNEIPARGFTTHTIAGHVVYECNQPCVQSIIAWSGRSLIGLKELKEQKHYYGGMESVSFPRLKALGLRWVYLPEFQEVHNDLMTADKCYVVYKWNYIHLNTTDLSFESWLLEDPKRLELK